MHTEVDMLVNYPCNHLRVGVTLRHGVVVPTVREDALPRRTIPESLPFGIRRPPEPESMRLSNLELLFVALAISALIYLGSSGPRMEDPWMKAAKAELQVSPALAQPLRHHLAVAQDN